MRRSRFFRPEPSLKLVLLAKALEPGSVRPSSPWRTAVFTALIAAALFAFVAWAWGA